MGNCRSFVSFSNDHFYWEHGKNSQIIQLNDISNVWMLSSSDISWLQCEMLRMSQRKGCRSEAALLPLCLCPLSSLSQCPTLWTKRLSRILRYSLAHSGLFHGEAQGAAFCGRRVSLHPCPRLILGTFSPRSVRRVSAPLYYVSNCGPALISQKSDWMSEPC